MKTALFVTDCSVDSALTVRNWLSAHSHQPIRLTVVLPYDIDEGQSLDKKSLQAAKSEASNRLKNWSDLLSATDPGSVVAETLLANPELAISMHLLIRRYDYWLVEDWSLVTNPTLSSILNQPTLQTLPLAINLAPALVTV
ncbi:hypothetical protein [Spirosoma fluviale]|uniref:Universal stress protein family protein n=1 Tax=Spirosoma fluviale TaxID=1597977 RepID=A0A286GD11_9BACT|nr:hypothetical protein [Spirosoma fluviale]SOD93390.1 hypothetical protein SAMN06269250_4480 [Spirosoma fluviale]